MSYHRHVIEFYVSYMLYVDNVLLIIQNITEMFSFVFK